MIRCVYCGRELKTEKSKNNGWGIICRNKYISQDKKQLKISDYMRGVKMETIFDKIEAKKLKQFDDSKPKTKPIIPLFKNHIIEYKPLKQFDDSKPKILREKNKTKNKNEYKGNTILQYISDSDA